jgi:hypothetical protein
MTRAATTPSGTAAATPISNRGAVNTAVSSTNGIASGKSAKPSMPNAATTPAVPVVHGVRSI